MDFDWSDDEMQTSTQLSGGASEESQPLEKKRKVSSPQTLSDSLQDMFSNSIVSNVIEMALPHML